MRKNILFLSVLFLAAIAASVYWWLNDARSADQTCKRSHVSAPFKRLSNEQSYPFLYGGRRISDLPEHPNYELYRSAIVRFPDVRSCLADSEMHKPIPDLVNFAWKKVKGHEDAEVCLFRVFSSIASIEGSRSWLEGQGFYDALIRTDQMKPGSSPYIPVQGFWDPMRCGRLYVIRHGWLDIIDQLTYPLLGLDPPTGVSGTFTEEGNIFGTTSFYTSK